MKLVVREHVNTISEVVKKVFSVNIQSIDTYGKISSGIGLMKGDLITFRSNGNPVRFPVGAPGKVLTSDSTQPTGLRWGDAGGGRGATTLLTNATGAQILRGTILYSQDGRQALKASQYCDKRLYISADDASSGSDVDCYSIPGSICQILVTGSCVKNDPLVVSATNGIAEVIQGGKPTVGYAMEGKASSAIGLVNVLLCENISLAVHNDDSESHVNGTVYEMSGGSTLDSGIEYANVKAAKHGKQPVGVQTNAQVNADTNMLIFHKPGERAYVMGDTSEIRVGDWLIPSKAIIGQACVGNGYGIGYALEAKAAGASGLVECLLMPGMYGLSKRTWYLPTGITEDQVIAAYQFVNRQREEEALLNINSGTEYALSKTSGVTWNSEKGFLIPANTSRGLQNSALTGTYSNLVTAAFGFNDASTASGNLAIGGIAPNYRRNLSIRGVSSGAQTYYQNSPSMNSYAGGLACAYTSVKQSAGVLSGTWGASANDTHLYHNGAVQSFAGTSGNLSINDIWGTAFVVGQNTVATPGSFNVTAVVWYNTALTAAQHLELSNNIRALGGIDN